MYHLTPIQAMIVVALFAIIFLTKSAKKSIDGADSTLASYIQNSKMLLNVAMGTYTARR